MTQERKHFSKIGLMFFIGSIVIYAIQWGAALAIGQIRPEWLENNTSWLLVSMLPMYLLGLPFLIFLISRVKAEGSIEKHNLSFGKMMIAFLMCYAITYISNMAGVMLTTVIGFLKGSPVENVLMDTVIGTDKGILFLFTVICAPIYEELIFRKLLVDRTVKYGEGVAVLLSGLLFGLFHGNLSQFAYAFFLGMFFAFIYARTGKIRYSIILHMIVNFLGGILSSFILEKIDYEGFMEMSQQMASGAAVDVAALQALVPGLLLLGVYVIVLLAVVVAGTILLIVYHKRFRAAQGEIIIPKGKRFSTVILNAGMLLFMVFWVIQMILQLLA